MQSVKLNAMSQLMAMKADILSNEIVSFICWKVSKN